MHINKAAINDNKIGRNLRSLLPSPKLCLVLAAGGGAPQVQANLTTELATAFGHKLRVQRHGEQHTLVDPAAAAAAP
jgi:hypothetical protein